MKKVTMAAKPLASPPTTPDAWVEAGRDGMTAPEATIAAVSPTRAATAPTVLPDVKMKRLTIDIPEELHMRIKSQCALRGAKMADEIRLLLEQHYGDSSE